MSCNREGVVWLHADGRWRYGQFDCYPVNQDDPDWDYEWDVEYTDEFAFVGKGSTAEQAFREWNGANPGGYTGYDGPQPDFDAKADAWEKEEQKHRRNQAVVHWPF